MDPTLDLLDPMGLLGVLDPTNHRYLLDLFVGFVGSHGSHRSVVYVGFD